MTSKFVFLSSASKQQVDNYQADLNKALVFFQDFRREFANFLNCDVGKIIWLKFEEDFPYNTDDFNCLHLNLIGHRKNGYWGAQWRFDFEQTFNQLWIAVKFESGFKKIIVMGNNHITNDFAIDDFNGLNEFYFNLFTEFFNRSLFEDLDVKDSSFNSFYTSSMVTVG